MNGHISQGGRIVLLQDQIRDMAGKHVKHDVCTSSELMQRVVYRSRRYIDKIINFQMLSIMFQTQGLVA